MAFGPPALPSNKRVSTPVPDIGVIRSLLSPEALCEEVARSYPIEPPVDCVLVRTYVNDVYRIRSAGRHYVLKIYRPDWRDVESLLWEIDLLSHLVERGVPVAAAIPRHDGHAITAFAALEGIRHGVLYEWAPGEKPSPPFTAQLFHRFGHAAGLVHERSSDFTSPYARRPLDLSVLIDEPLTAIRPFLAHHPKDWGYLTELAEKLRTSITSLAARGLDWGVCHQDMTLDNVHVTPDGEVTFYDFDSGGPGWRSLDFQGIYQAALYNKNDHWDAFLAGYSEVRQLGQADLAAIPYFVLAYQVWGLHMAVLRSKWTGIYGLNDDFFEGQFGPDGWWRRWNETQLM